MYNMMQAEQISFEQRLERIEKNLFGVSDMDVPEVSQSLYTRLQSQYDKDSQDMLDGKTAKLADKNMY